MFTTFFRKHLENDYRSLASVCLATTLLTIFIQKIFFACDASFLYDKNMFARATESESYALVSMFSLIKNESMRVYFWMTELALIVGLFIRMSSLVYYGLLLFFSINTFYGAAYLQDGGTNLSHLFLVFSVILVLSKNSRFSGRLQNHFAFAGVSLFRFQMVFLYFAALVSKLQGSLWRSGTALYYIFQNGYFSNPLAKEMVMTYPLLSTLGCYAAIAFQAAFPLVLVVARLRIPLLIAGASFHMLIAFFMNIWLFSVSMIAFYIVFLRADEASKLIQFAKDKAPRINEAYS